MTKIVINSQVQSNILASSPSVASSSLSIACSNFLVYLAFMRFFSTAVPNELVSFNKFRYAVIRDEYIPKLLSILLCCVLSPYTLLLFSYNLYYMGCFQQKHYTILLWLMSYLFFAHLF